MALIVNSQPMYVTLSEIKKQCGLSYFNAYTTILHSCATYTYQSFKISSKETLFSKTALINDTTGLHNNDIQHGAESERDHR